MNGVKYLRLNNPTGFLGDKENPPKALATLIAQRNCANKKGRVPCTVSRIRIRHFERFRRFYRNVK
jgi:hypothetical protein